MPSFPLGQRWNRAYAHDFVSCLLANRQEIVTALRRILLPASFCKECASTGGHAQCLIRRFFSGLDLRRSSDGRGTMRIVVISCKNVDFATHPLTNRNARIIGNRLARPGLGAVLSTLFFVPGHLELLRFDTRRKAV